MPSGRVTRNVRHVGELWRRVRDLPGWVVDVVIAAVALLTGLLTTGGSTDGSVTYEPRDAGAYLLIVLASVPLLLRSRMPVTVLLVTGSAVAALLAGGHSAGALPGWLLVVAATVGARYPVRRVVATGAAIVVLLVVLLALEHDRSFGPATFATQLALFTTAFTFGANVQSRRQREEALEQRAAALEATRTEEARRAVADERLRIAQELHDVLAHTLSVVSVQAGAGAHVVDSNPTEARRALDTIATTSRASLTELRRLLGVLRSTDDGSPYVPAPGLGDLERLAAEVTSAGVPVRLVVDGTPDGTSPGVELTAYRIVQEALTNVLKHAGPAHAEVRVCHRPGALDIEVTDDGRGLAARGGSGHGLIGMRERVAMYGGTLQTGPASGGGFRVVAHLPYGEDPS
jgi:signal transduction histidine kinase